MLPLEPVYARADLRSGETGSHWMDEVPLRDRNRRRTPLPAGRPCAGAVRSRCSRLHALPARRSLGRPPCRERCSGTRPGCGCERRVGRAQALFTARRGGCAGRRQWLLRQALEASTITAPAGRDPAGAVAGGERESASWQIWGTWEAAGRRGLPGSQDSSFQFSAPAGGLGGRDRGRGSA